MFTSSKGHWELCNDVSEGHWAPCWDHGFSEVTLPTLLERKQDSYTTLCQMVWEVCGLGRVNWGSAAGAEQKRRSGGYGSPVLGLLRGLILSVHKGLALKAHTRSSSTSSLQSLKNNNKSHCISYRWPVHLYRATWTTKFLFQLIIQVVSVRQGRTEELHSGGISKEGSCHHSQPEVENKVTARVAQTYQPTCTSYAQPPKGYTAS